MNCLSRRVSWPPLRQALDVSCTTSHSMRGRVRICRVWRGAEGQIGTVPARCGGTKLGAHRPAKRLPLIYETREIAKSLRPSVLTTQFSANASGTHEPLALPLKPFATGFMTPTQSVDAARCLPHAPAVCPACTPRSTPGLHEGVVYDELAVGLETFVEVAKLRWHRGREGRWGEMHRSHATGKHKCVCRIEPGTMPCCGGTCSSGDGEKDWLMNRWTVASLWAADMRILF